MTPVDFPWHRVDRAGDCWVWTGATRDGYGTTTVRGRTVTTHRLAWTTTNGAIPQGMLVLHHCDNRACVRPDHLYLGTHDQNMADMVRRGRSRSPVFRGEDAPWAKLDYEKAEAIRRRVARGEPRQVLAVEFGVSLSLIGSVVSGRAWSKAA